MRLPIGLKLNLSKQTKRITVKYNTFEKATYDQYLICSLVLHTKRDAEDSQQYVHDITGDGSLNQHFMKLYEDICVFSDAQLQQIIRDSMYPTIKIDSSNRYDYYPELDVSVFLNKVFSGDFGNYDDLTLRLGIQEQVIEKTVDVVKETKNPESYTVVIEDGNTVKIRLKDKEVPISEEFFRNSLVVDLTDISKYRGIVHDKAEGGNWRVLTSAAYNNLFADSNSFYDENGDHNLIQKNYTKKTMIACIYGLNIYHEDNIPYTGNVTLCERVLRFLKENGKLRSFSVQTLLVLWRQVTPALAQEGINSILWDRTDKEVAQYGLNLMQRGILFGWSDESLRVFLKYADKSQTRLIYDANKNLQYSIDQLLSINFESLTPEHRKKVNNYLEDLEEKRKTIREITGDITTKGLRENAKELESDDITKRFSKLCNQLIGHVQKGLNSVDTITLEKWLQDALELKELSIHIERKIAAKNRGGYDA